MTNIELDDGLYIRARQHLRGRTAGGVIEMFHGFLDIAELADEPERRAAIDGLLAAIGDDAGDYSRLAAPEMAEARRAMWSYHRAWSDCYGAADGISSSLRR